MSDWNALRQSVTSGLSMAICGIPWWNSDIGGFLMGDTQSEEFRELLVRWFQFGLFCPIMRLHGWRLRIKDQTVRNPGIIEPSGGPNEIWCFGNENYDYLPEGRWVSVIDGQVYEGKQWITVHAALSQYIAFVKEGSSVLKIFL